jgi:hypothetical protein
LFSYDWYHRKELCHTSTRMLECQCTKYQHHCHKNCLILFMDRHSREFHSKFVFCLGKSLPNQNHKFCIHPLLTYMYVGQNNILWFEVSVHNTVIMHLFYTLANLFQFFSNFALLHFFFLLHKWIEWSIFHILDEYIKVLSIREVTVDFD